MKTNLDPTQFEDNSLSTTCTVSVYGKARELSDSDRIVIKAVHSKLG